MSISNIVSTITPGSGLTLSGSDLIISPTYMGVASGTITSAQFKSILSPAFTVVPAVSGYTIIPTLMLLAVDYNTTQYADGSAVVFQYESTINASTEIPASQFTSAFSEVSSATFELPHPNTNADLMDLPLKVTVVSADFTTGDSDVNYLVQYALVQF